MEQNPLLDGQFDTLTLVLLTLSAWRIYLEMIRFDFMALPLSRRLAHIYGRQNIDRFHRFGFILGVGYFVLHGPLRLFA